MNGQNHNTNPLRTGMRRVIPPFEFRHLRTFGCMRVGGSVVQVICGVLILSFGGNDGTTYGWAAFFLGLAALNFAVGYWQLNIARSASPRT